MKLETLGLITEFAIASADAQIQDNGDHIIVATPDNPDFYFGNFVIFAKPPTLDSISVWENIFSQNFPKAEHKAFAWQGHITTDDSTKLKARGYQIYEHIVLQRNTNPSSTPQTDLTCRPLVSDADWDAAVQNHYEARQLSEELQKKRLRFLQKLFAKFRRLTLGQSAVWYGAFLQDELIGTLGICACENLGRFQEVVLKEKFRSQGFGTQFVALAMNDALTRLPIDTFVIVAEAGSVAERVYRKLGFGEATREQGMLWVAQTP